MLLFGIWISEIWFFEFVKIGCLDFSKNSLCGKFSIITFSGTWDFNFPPKKTPNNAVFSYFKWKYSNSRVCLLSRNEKSNWLSVNVTIGLYCFFFSGHSLTEQGHKQSKIVSNSMQLIHQRSISTPHNPIILLSCMIKMFDLSEQPHKFQPRNIRNIKIRKSDFFEKTKTPQK